MVRGIDNIYIAEIKEFLDVLLPDTDVIILDVTKKGYWYVDVIFEIDRLPGKLVFYQDHVDGRDLMMFTNKSYVKLIARYFYEAKGFIPKDNPFSLYSEEDIR